MRRLDEMLLGGPPETNADIYRERSPITYADDMIAPMLIWQGRNDTRTPPAQMIAYADRLAALGHPFQLHWYEGGHGLGDKRAYVDHLECATTFTKAAVGASAGQAPTSSVVAPARIFDAPASDISSDQPVI